MNILENHLVVALGEDGDSPLARFLRSLGARICLANPDQLTATLVGASFLIDRCSMKDWAESSIERDSIQRLYPTLIHMSITPFGHQSTYAQLPANEFIVSALGGALALTGDPDRPPVKEALNACLFHTDMVAAAAAMAAHHERQRSLMGQYIDISAQEATFSRAINPILVWQFDRRKLHRLGGALGYGRAVVRCIWRLADGWCFHTLMTGRLGAPANQALSDWMDSRGVDNPLRGTDWLKYDRSALDATIRQRWETAIDAFFRTCTKNEIATEGRKRGINATVICEPLDALRDPHLQARNFWQTKDGISLPGRFFAASEGPPVEPKLAKSPKEDRGPLSGLRILDFSWALVGSITTKVLGDLGADVIKIESRSRPCLSRIDRQVSASQAGNLDDKPWFAHLNTSKRSVALDLKVPASREIIEPLVKWADIVVENFSPGTMEKLHLDYPALQRLNPRIIMVSGSVYGQTGPLAREWGVDGTGAALSGRTFLTGWPDRDPVIPAALPYGDVVVPYVMAAAAIAAIQNRNKNHRGSHIDVAMYEVCLQQTYAAILQAQTGNVPQRFGNDCQNSFHQAVYPSRVEDRWLAIRCPTEQEWKRLCEIANVDAGPPEKCAPEIATWSRSHDAVALANQLRSCGLCVVLVQDIEDLMEHDPGLAERNPLIVLDHPLLGPFGHLRTPMHFSRSSPNPYRAPRMGEHSCEVSTGVAGISADRYAELEALGVFK